MLVGQVLMSGHIGSGDSEFGNLCEALDSRSVGTRGWEIEEGTNRKIGRKAFEVGLPGLAGAAAVAVASGAVALKETFPPCGIGLSHCLGRGLPLSLIHI